MKRLNGMDAMLLYSETPNLHTHTLKVAIIDATSYDATHDNPYSFEVFRRTIARRLHLLEPLRYRLVDIPFRLHHPMWLENCDVHLDYHVRTVSVPAPGGRRELDEVIGRIASTRSTATGRCGSSTSQRDWPTTASRWSARCTTPWPTASLRRICWRG